MKRRGKKTLVLYCLVLFAIIFLFVLPFVSGVSFLEKDFSVFQFPPRITFWTVKEPSPELTIVNVYPSQEIGRVRSDFYGANTHGWWLRSGRNLTWHRETWIDGKYVFSREDMSLGSYYTNGTGNWSILRKGDTNSITLEYEWAREKGVKIMNIINYMPEWLADNSSGNCLNLKFCPPLNYTYFGELVKDYINRTTLNGEYLDVVEYEFWNEPDISFFMGGLSADHVNKSIEINKMFNATSTIIRQSYPNAVIGGPGLASCYSSNLRNNFLGNFSNPNSLNFSNFFSCHNYISPILGQANIYTTTQTKINKIYETCNSLGAQETCKNIYISEFNLGHSVNDDWIKNTSSRAKEYGENYGLFYMASLNSYPENITMQTYQWADSVVYGPGYPEYPHQWYSVQEPALGLEYKPLYNITKDFAHYHASGNMIVNSSSSNDTIKVVASINPEGVWHITLINTDGGGKKVSINLSSLSEVEALKDLSTGEVYNVEGGFVDVGPLEHYDVKHYESADYVPIVKSVSSSSKRTNNINTASGRGVLEIDNLSYDYSDNSNIENESIDLEGIESSGYNEYDDSSSSNHEGTDEPNLDFSGSSTELEEESLLSEEVNSKKTGNDSNSGFISEVKALKDNPLVIISGILVLGILILVIIYLSHKRKQKQAKLARLKEWVGKARSLGYTDERMKEMLREYSWDDAMIQGVLWGIYFDDGD